MKIAKKSHKVLKSLLLSFIALAFIILVIPLFIVGHYKKLIFVNTANVPNFQVAIVFGASVKSDGSPSDILKDRLNTAAELYQTNRVQKILVSGDNRSADYNEPKNMAAYLIENRYIPAEDILQDPAGLRTYDTCIRAKEVWMIEEAILITQGYHLIRALMTCNQVGIESYGLSATNQSYVKESYFKLREIAAIYKSLVDLYIWRPDYQEGHIKTTE